MKNKGKIQAEKSKPNVTCFSIAEETYSNDATKLERYKKQREEQGFDDTETWHLDRTFALFMIPRIKRFIQVNNGFPNGETYESYIEKLKFVVKSFEEYYLDDNIETSLELEKERLENAKQAVDILSKLWFCLWW